MPPPVASGLLWSTDSAIEFARTGAAVPAIPMARGAGPLYVVISYSQAATPGEDEPAIFYIGNPSDNLYTTNIFHVFRNWGTGIGVATTPGRGMMVDLPAPPSDFVGEIWAASAGSNMVSYLTGGWYMDPIPDHSPVATSHLFIGYKPDGANPAWRGAGTIHRMAIYDRVPDAGERAQLVEWVQSQGAPPITGVLAAASRPGIADFAAMVQWPGITATLSAIGPASVADFAASVQWPGIAAVLSASGPESLAAFEGQVRWPRVEGSMDASSPEANVDFRASVVWPRVEGSMDASSPGSLAAFEGQVRWPGISAELSGTSLPAVADGSGRVATTAQLIATSPTGRADFAASVRWPSVVGGLDAEARPSVAQGEAAVGVAGEFAAHSPPPVAMFWAGSGWVPVSARLEAASPVSLSTATVAVGNLASLHGTSSAAVADFAGMVRWAGLEATLVAVSRESHAAMHGHVHTSGWLAVAGESVAAAAVGAVGVRAALDASSPQPIASIIEKQHLVSERYTFPGPRPAGDLLQPSRSGGGLIGNERSRGQLIEVR